MPTLGVIDLKFQFHNGAIGVVTGDTPRIVADLFQFHNGAIGVGINPFSVASPVLFQFHNGAIGVANSSRCR